MADQEQLPANERFLPSVSHLNVLPSRQNVIVPDACGAPVCLVGLAPKRLHSLEGDFASSGASAFASPSRDSPYALAAPLLATTQDAQPSAEELESKITQSEQFLSLAPTQSQLAAEEDQDTIGVPEVIFNLANTVIGVGVVSIPYAFRLSGYSTLLLILLVILITSYTAKLIGASLTLASKDHLASEVPRKARDFAFLAHVAFGEKGRWFVGGITALEVWFALVTFMVMNGVNASLLLPVEQIYAVVASCILSAFLVLLPMWLFSYVSLVSTISLAAAGFAMICCVSRMSQWANPFDHFGPSALLKLQNVPRSVGIIVFCFAGHPCFPIVHECMRNRAAWGFSVDVTFTAALIYYGGLGLLGYVVFGEDLEASFTQNMAKVPHALMFRQIAALAFIIKTQLTAPLLLNATLVSILPPKAGEAQWSKRRLGGLCALVGVTTLTAAAFAKHVADVAALTGSFCTMVTSVLFPTFAHMWLKRRLCSPEDIWWGTWLPHYLVIAFGIFMAISGTVLSVFGLSQGSTE